MCNKVYACYVYVSVIHYLRVRWDLFATETDNELNTELGGYKNIVVAQPIAVVSEGLTSCLDSVPHGSGESDCILCCDGYT